MPAPTEPPAVAVIGGGPAGLMAAEVLAEAGLTIPAESPFRSTGKRGVHTEHMGYILAELQHLQRAFPGGAW